MHLRLTLGLTLADLQSGVFICLGWAQNGRYQNHNISLDDAVPGLWEFWEEAYSLLGMSISRRTLHRFASESSVESSSRGQAPRALLDTYLPA